MEDQKMQLVDWLDDLCVRFIINLPQEELESVERICFQIEEAQWFYEDFIRPLDPSLPSLQLRTFALQMFQHCPLFADFHESQYVQAFDQFLAYKTRVPVRGAIILNDTMDQVVLVKGWKKGSSWSFPRGKINKDERDLDCAVREAYEEIGYDLNAAGLVGDESKMKYIEVTMREQHMKLYVFRGVPMDTPFAPRTRKEISKISWYKLASLPGWQRKKHQQQSLNEEDEVLTANKMYMVAPFLHPLKGWITQQRKLEKQIVGRTFGVAHPAAANVEGEEYIIDDRDARHHRQPSELLHGEHDYSQIDGAAQHLASLEHGSAAGLERLLSVEEPTSTRIAQNGLSGLDSNATNLLAMLRSNSYVNTFQSDQQHVQHQPYNEANARLPRPVDLHYQNLNHPSSGTALQPQGAPFGHVPRHPPHQYDANVFPSQVPQTLQHFTTSSIRPQPPNQPSLLGLLNQPASHAYGSSSTPPAPAPYHRIGDPQFARGPQVEAQHTSIVPPASELSAPKLSSQAQSLLDVFKSSSINKKRVDASESPNPQGQPLLSNISPIVPRPQTDVMTERRHVRHSNQLSTERPRNQAVNSTLSHTPTQPSQDHRSIIQTAPSSRGHTSNFQQNALLDLFRKPSVPSATYAKAVTADRSTVADLLGSASLGANLVQPSDNVSTLPVTLPSLQVQQAPATPTKAIVQPMSPTGKKEAIHSLVAESVELSANQSPEIGKKHIFDHRDGKMKEHVTSPRVANRSHDLARVAPGLERPLASATVTGPVQVPDLGATKRRTRQNKSESTPNKSEASIVPKHNTVKILKRPGTPRQAGQSEPELSPRPAPSSKVLSSPRAEASPMRSTRNSVASPTSAILAPIISAKVASPKPFAPQILRRPPPAASGPAIIESTVMPTQDSMPDVAVIADAKIEHPAPPQDPKNDLLSLFRKSSMPIPTTAPTAIVASPPPEKIIPDPTSQAPSISASNDTKDLLSLFAKPSKPASATNPRQADPSSLSSTQSMEQASIPPSRSRFNSIASRDKATTPLMSPSGQISVPATATQSRRGSQTPISPSDRGFLLNYLDGFTKGLGQKK